MSNDNPANIGAEGLPVSSSGTARDFGNMLNAHIPRKTKIRKDRKAFSPWTKMEVKHGR